MKDTISINLFATLSKYSPENSQPVSLFQFYMSIRFGETDFLKRGEM